MPTNESLAVRTQQERTDRISADAKGTRMKTTKTLAYAPGVLISTVLTMVVGAVLPALVGWVVFVGGLLTMALLLGGVGETAALRVFYRARHVTEAENAALSSATALLRPRELGPPVVDLWIETRSGLVAAGGVGRRSVIVSGGLVAAVRAGQLPPDQAAAVIAHATGVVRVGATRSDAALMFWTMPWQILRGLSQGVARVFSWLPLVGSVWRLRFVLGATVAAQSWNEGTPAARVAGGLAVLVIALSYLMPRWELAWAAALSNVGDDQVKRAGMGGPLSRFLRRCSSSPATFERIHRMQDPPDMDWSGPA